jgi:hypothetical protein
VDAEARKVLDAGPKSNGLADPAMKPWHAKVDFQEALNLVDGRKMFGGLDGRVVRWALFT